MYNTAIIIFIIIYYNFYLLPYSSHPLDHHCWQRFCHCCVLEASQQTQANFVSSYQLSCYRSACWIHGTNSVGTLWYPGASGRKRNIQPGSQYKYFNPFSSNVFFRVSIFPDTYLSGTCICSDLAALPSRSKYKGLHLQCHFSLDSSNICRDIDFASCIWHTGFYTMDSSIRLSPGFMFGYGLRVLSDNPEKIEESSSHSQRT